VITLQGQLPGVPVTLDVNTGEFEIVEAPAAANQWNAVTIRSMNGFDGVMTIHWATLP
jgi:hypothetical protein